MQREYACAQRPADDLVHRVVASDVLPDRERLAGVGKETGGVQAAGALEGRLAEAVRERGEQGTGDGGAGRRRRRGGGPPLPPAPATHAARTGRGESAAGRPRGQAAP